MDGCSSRFLQIDTRAMLSGFDFDLITDSAVPGVGLAIDNVAVPELGFFDDVETSILDWTSSGFIQTG